MLPCPTIGEYLKDGEYYIDYSNESVGRVSIRAIEKGLSVSISNNNNDKSAYPKYKSILQNKVSIGDSYTFSKVDRAQVGLKKNSIDNRVFYDFSSNGKKGKLVFTGQPNSKKRFEFIFWEKNLLTIKIDRQTIKDFFFAYFDDLKDADVKKLVEKNAYEELYYKGLYDCLEERESTDYKDFIKNGRYLKTVAFLYSLRFQAEKCSI